MEEASRTCEEVKIDDKPKQHNTTVVVVVVTIKVLKAKQIC